MKDYTALQRERLEFVYEESDLRKAIKICKKHGQAHEVLSMLAEQAKQNIANKWKEMEKLENNCSHPEWKSAGHDSHKSYEACIVCGKEVSV
jgi:hypothetical protein